MAISFVLITCLSKISSGRDKATTDIIKANAVPTPTPLFISAPITGIMPLALEYIGIPIATAAKTANGFCGPAYFC